MPIIDDAAGADLQPTVSGRSSQQPAPEAEGTGNGNGTARGAVVAGAGGQHESRSSENPAMTLARLRAEAQEMKAAKKVLTKNLKNARRINARLRAKARKLSDEELLQIVAMRNGVAMVQNPCSSGSNGGASSSSSRQVVTARENVIAGGGADSDEKDDEDAVTSGSATSHPVENQRLADRMEL